MPDPTTERIRYGSREWPAGGVEKQFRAITNGQAIVLGDSYDRWHRRILRPRMGQHPAAKAGNDLLLTLDASVQEVVEQALDECWQQRRPAGLNAVVLAAKTGEILAMACRPTYDPNNITKRKQPGNHDGNDNGMAHLANRPVIHPMEPGSTFKVLTIAAALEYGVITPNSTYTCSGTEQIGGRPLSCWGRWAHGGHGSLTPQGVLANSCNLCAAKIALDIGPERFWRFLRECRIARKLYAGFPGEWPGMLEHPEDMKTRDLANLGFGQGLSCTDLALAAAVAAVTNKNGNYMHPHILRAYADPTSGKYYEVKPRIITTVCSQRTSHLMRKFLRGVVEHGTGKVAHIPGCAVGGKTATAQIFNPATGRYMQQTRNHVMSFLLVAPVDTDPDFVIVVSVERPQNGKHGSDVAGPIAKRIAKFLLTRPELFAPDQRLPMPDAVITEPTPVACW